MTDQVCENGVMREATPAEKAELAAMRLAVLDEQVRQANAAIRAKLAEIDARSVRPLRAILDAQAAGLMPDPADVAFLNTLKAEADALRSSLVT